MPSDFPDGPVRVIVIAPRGPSANARHVTFGQFSGDKKSMLDDFKEAGWHGEEEFDDLYGN